MTKEDNKKTPYGERNFISSFLLSVVMRSPGTDLYFADNNRDLWILVHRVKIVPDISSIMVHSGSFSYKFTSSWLKRWWTRRTMDHDRKEMFSPCNNRAWGPFLYPKVLHGCCWRTWCWNPFLLLFGGFNIMFSTVRVPGSIQWWGGGHEVNDDSLESAKAIVNSWPQGPPHWSRNFTHTLLQYNFIFPLPIIHPSNTFRYYFRNSLNLYGISEVNESVLEGGLGGNNMKLLIVKDRNPSTPLYFSLLT